MKLKGRALVLGKFHPLHKGHEFLLRFAGNSCENVTVLVDKFEGQKISGQKRVGWIKELFPTYTVKALKHYTPQQPGEIVNFWNYWKSTITRYAGKVDYVVASETYAVKLAEVLGAKLIMCNQPRTIINSSATNIKRQPQTYWNHLTTPCKRDYQQKVLILGPECSGKTTAAKDLAAKLSGTFIPEYVEEQLRTGRKLTQELLKEALICQVALEQSAACLYTPVLIMDSNFLTTQIWHKTLFKDSIAKPKGALTPNITLLFKPLKVWVNDKHRIAEQAPINVRQQFFLEMKQSLIKLNWPFHIISGSKQECVSTALTHIKHTSKLAWQTE